MTKEKGARFAVKGVRINAGAPVFVYSPFTENIVGTPDVHAKIKRLHMMGRRGQPKEVAFLALDDASVVTASVWPVNGWQTAQKEGTLSHCIVETGSPKHPLIKQQFEMTFLVAGDLQLRDKQDCRESAGNG